MSTTRNTRSAKAATAPEGPPPAGLSDSLGGHAPHGNHVRIAAEGQDSPQASFGPASISSSPAGSRASRSQNLCDTHVMSAAADNFPDGQEAIVAQAIHAAGDQAPVPARAVSTPISYPPVRDQVSPAATLDSTPSVEPLLADPLLALAADVLDDLERVRIANENRLRQLTRTEEDGDGETRGFGLDESHPDVARLAALVGMLADAEHKATLNLQRVMRKHPLGPWLAAQKGIGEKQGARLLAALGDPYIRPEIVREDGAVEPSRPRRVSELWAYCGYHVIKTPVGHEGVATQSVDAGGKLNRSDPGHGSDDAHPADAGVAPKRKRGEHANWSAAAKMRAFLVAESCMKKSGTPYRAAYDAARAKYADAVHAAECVRCGPKGKPAQPGSPLSDGHKHARGLRAVAKEILKQLWREARRIHLEASAGDQRQNGTHAGPVASGDILPPPITGTAPSVSSVAEPVDGEAA